MLGVRTRGTPTCVCAQGRGGHTAFRLPRSAEQPLGTLGPRLHVLHRGLVGEVERGDAGLRVHVPELAAAAEQTNKQTNKQTNDEPTAQTTRTRGPTCRSEHPALGIACVRAGRGGAGRGGAGRGGAGRGGADVLSAEDVSTAFESAVHATAYLHELRAPHTCHICAGTGRTLATSALGVGSPLPHLHRDWAHPCHICTGSGLTPAHMPTAATSAPGLADCPSVLRRECTGAAPFGTPAALSTSIGLRALHGQSDVGAL